MRGVDEGWFVGYIQLLEVVEDRPLTAAEIQSAYEGAKFGNFTIVDLHPPLTPEEKYRYREENRTRILEALDAPET